MYVYMYVCICMYVRMYVFMQGDNTFCIAALLAMKNKRSHVLIGAMAANAVMSVLTTVLGYVIYVHRHTYMYDAHIPYTYIHACTYTI